jgi:quercetin dioxygenase-like cupin family protein
MVRRPTPIRTDPAPDPVDPELEPLLSEAFAAAWSASPDGVDSGSGPLRQRLLERLAASKAASATMVTSRLRHGGGVPVAEGVAVRTLYAAPADRPLRPGEPQRASLVELQPGACWTVPGSSPHREWLVLRGDAQVGSVALTVRDYHVAPAGLTAPVVRSVSGGRVFLRESVLPAQAPSQAFTVRDAESGWPDYAPGIRRRVLWQHDGQAALLYHAEAGASVPVHIHGHDEECLMVQGELFLDDILLQEGDYQLAPAGTGHRITETDTGVVLYAHGDLDLKFIG